MHLQQPHAGIARCSPLAALLNLDRRLERSRWSSSDGQQADKDDCTLRQGAVQVHLFFAVGVQSKSVLSTKKLLSSPSRKFRSGNRPEQLNELAIEITLLRLS